VGVGGGGAKGRGRCSVKEITGRSAASITFVNANAKLQSLANSSEISSTYVCIDMTTPRALLRDEINAHF